MLYHRTSPERYRNPPAWCSSPGQYRVDKILPSPLQVVLSPVRIPTFGPCLRTVLMGGRDRPIGIPSLLGKLARMTGKGAWRRRGRAGNVEERLGHAHRDSGRSWKTSRARGGGVPTRDVSPPRRFAASQKHMSRGAGFRDCGSCSPHRLTNKLSLPCFGAWCRGAAFRQQSSIQFPVAAHGAGCQAMSLEVLWALGGLRRRSGVRWWCWVWRSARVRRRGLGGLANPISDWTASGRDRMMSGLKPTQASAVFGPTSSWKERRDTRKLLYSLGSAVRKRRCAGRCSRHGLPSQPSPGVGQACSCRQIPTKIREMPRRARVDVFLVQPSRTSTR